MKRMDRFLNQDGNSLETLLALFSTEYVMPRKGPNSVRIPSKRKDSQLKPYRDHCGEQMDFLVVSLEFGGQVAFWKRPWVILRRGNNYGGLFKTSNCPVECPRDSG